MHPVAKTVLIFAALVGVVVLVALLVMRTRPTGELSRAVKTRSNCNLLDPFGCTRKEADQLVYDNCGTGPTCVKPQTIPSPRIYVKQPSGAALEAFVTTQELFKENKIGFTNWTNIMGNGLPMPVDMTFTNAIVGDRIRTGMLPNDGGELERWGESVTLTSIDKQCLLSELHLNGHPMGFNKGSKSSTFYFEQPGRFNLLPSAGFQYDGYVVRGYLIHSFSATLKTLSTIQNQVNKQQRMVLEFETQNIPLWDSMDYLVIRNPREPGTVVDNPPDYFYGECADVCEAMASGHYGDPNHVCENSMCSQMIQFESLCDPSGCTLLQPQVCDPSELKLQINAQCKTQSELCDQACDYLHDIAPNDDCDVPYCVEHRPGRLKACILNASGVLKGLRLWTGGGHASESYVGINPKTGHLASSGKRSDLVNTVWGLKYGKMVNVGTGQCLDAITLQLETCVEGFHWQQNIAKKWINEDGREQTFHIEHVSDAQTTRGCLMDHGSSTLGDIQFLQPCHEQSPSQVFKLVPDQTIPEDEDNYIRTATNLYVQRMDRNPQTEATFMALLPEDGMMRVTWSIKPQIVQFLDTSRPADNTIILRRDTKIFIKVLYGGKFYGLDSSTQPDISCGKTSLVGLDGQNGNDFKFRDTNGKGDYDDPVEYGEKSAIGGDASFNTNIMQKCDNWTWYNTNNSMSNFIPVVALRA